MPVSIYFHAGEPHQLFSDQGFGFVLLDGDLAVAGDGAAIVCQKVTLGVEPDPSVRSDWTWLANQGGATPEAIAELQSYGKPVALHSDAFLGLAEPVHTEFEDGTSGTAYKVNATMTLTHDGAVVTPTGGGEPSAFPYEEAREIDLKTAQQWQKFVPSKTAGRLQITLDARKLAALADSMGPDGLVTLAIGDTTEPILATCPGNNEALGLIMPIHREGAEDLTKNEIFLVAQQRQVTAESATRDAQFEGARITHAD